MVCVLSIQPSGYRAEYAPPQQFAIAPEKLRSPAVNGVTSGRDIKKYAGQVKELGQDRFVLNWLAASQFLVPYSALLVKLDTVAANCRPGGSIVDLQLDYEMDTKALKELSQTADTY